MTTEAAPGVALISPRVGGGKDTFKEAIKPHLIQAGVRVDDIDPGGIGFTKRAVWNGIRNFYSLAAKNDIVAKFYANTHSGRKPLRDAVMSWASTDLMKKSEELNDIPLVFHGLIGKDWVRYFAEGDVLLEPSAAYPDTICFVPLEENIRQLRNDYHQYYYEPYVAGFIVPEEVKNKERKENRKEAFGKNGNVNLTFLASGQLAEQHFDTLYRDVFSGLHASIKHEPHMKINVYTWTSESKAQEVKKQADEKRLSVGISNTYVPNSQNEVQIYFNKNPDEATRLSFKLGEMADFLLTPLGERMAWSAFMPLIPLAPIPGNIKMLANYKWALERGLILPASESVAKQILQYLKKGEMRRHFEKADEVFNGGAMLNGARYIADVMKLASHMKAEGHVLR